MSSSQRDRELARRRAERQAARQTALAQRRKQRNAVIGSVVAVLLVAGAVVAGSLALRDPAGPSDSVASSSTRGSTPAPSAPGDEPTSGAAAAPAGDPGCAYEKSGAAARPVPLPPADDVDTTEVYDVTLATDRGDIVFEMDSASAPCTAHSLRSLAAAGYFDGTRCHRLTTSGISVLQCGDPEGTGSGGPGYSFADENLEGATYPRGTVAMANAGPDTNGSQFFLVYGDTPLPPAYTPFGRITSGLEVLDAVAEAGTTTGAPDGAPKLGVTLKSVRATPKDT